MPLYYKPFNTERSLDKGNPVPHEVLPLEPHLKHFFSLHCKTLQLCHLLRVPYKMPQRKKKIRKIRYLLNQATELPLYEHLICTLIQYTDIPPHKPFKKHCCMLSGGGLFALCKDSFFEISHFQGRWGVQLGLLLLTPLSCFSTEVTDSFTGPSLKWEWGQGCWQGRGDVGKQKPKNHSPRLPWPWKKQLCFQREEPRAPQLGEAGFESQQFFLCWICHLVSSSKKGSLSSAPLHISLLLLPVPTLIRNCSNNARDNLCACICQGILQYSWIEQHTKNMAWLSW